MVLIGVLQYAHPGAVAWRHALAVSGWSVLFSALVLTADDRTCGTRRFLAVQTLGDLAAVSAGILYGATSPSVGLLLRPLLILVVVPISLLSVSLGLATALGGTITVRSKIGHGTCFAVTLPARWVEVPLAPREPLVAA